MTNSNPPPPEPLGVHGQSLWDSIAGQWALRADEHRTLANACKLADQVAAMETALAEAGSNLMLPGSRPGTWVAHPLLGELRMSRQVMSQLLARLDLPEDDADSGAAPLTVHQNARKAALVRHRGRHGA